MANQIPVPVPRPDAREFWGGLREFWIEKVRSEGDPGAIEELNRLLEFEAESGARMPPIVFGRLRTGPEGKWFREHTKAYKSPTILPEGKWFREHTKAYESPTILDAWKNSFPAPVAVWFFDECHVLSIELALYFDFKKPIGEECLSKELLATCYAFHYLTGDQPGSHHGIWHQGLRAYKQCSAKKSKNAATVLHRLKVAGTIDSDGLADEFDTKYCNGCAGREVKEIEAIAFTGAGYRRFFG